MSETGFCVAIAVTAIGAFLAGFWLGEPTPPTPPQPEKEDVK